MDFYYLKRTRFLKQEKNIVLQNQNGPCPLVAIINALHLNGQIPIPLNLEIISHSQLLSLLTNFLLANNRPFKNENLRINQEKILADIMELMPSLGFGLDVNVKFTSVTSFEYTVGCSLFDMLNIRLVHGWLADPDDPQSHKVISPLSYNQMVDIKLKKDLLISNSKSENLSQIIQEKEKEFKEKEKEKEKGIQEIKEKEREKPKFNVDLDFDESSDSEDTNIIQNQPKIEEQNKEQEFTKEIEEQNKEEEFAKKIQEQLRNFQNEKTKKQTQKEREEAFKDMTEEQKNQIIYEGKIIEKFLEDNPSQLTFYGITQLHSKLKDHEIAVLFRNNHFMTIFKYKFHLFSLLTDEGYKDSPHIVWESLTTVGGDNDFYNHRFHVSRNLSNQNLNQNLNQKLNQKSNQKSNQNSNQKSNQNSNQNSNQIEKDRQLALKLLREQQQEEQIQQRQLAALQNQAFDSDIVYDNPMLYQNQHVNQQRFYNSPNEMYQAQALQHQQLMQERLAREQINPPRVRQRRKVPTKKGGCNLS
ncbi:nf-e2 inducible protein [Anaeramoeba ignava]|uniref:Nf-e2 inducible protein n=1 Tax=Anaeramoeba ignava TaxID=1746090 RepID=A0A9Q0LY62_ANAIG|nr:nf-e2 inducible protein [Anaeramoeba ignava]